MSLIFNGQPKMSGQIKIRDSLASPTVPSSTVSWTFTGSQASGRLGWSVDISGNYAISGEPQTGAGVAYVYDITTGQTVHTIPNPTTTPGQSFGRSVAIDGNYVIIGEPFDDFGTNGAGSAYIYDLTSGTPTIPVHTLHNPTPSSSDWFGEAVAIDGNYAIVGCENDSGSGKAYIYNVITGALVHTLNNPVPSSGDKFGDSVSISGNYAIVGAPQDDTGASNAGSVYIYNVTTGSLSHTLNNPTTEISGRFGYSVAIDGNRLIVGNLRSSGTGAVNIYDVTTGDLLYTINNPESGVDYFGYSVAISGDYAVIGAMEDDVPVNNSGSVYVYNIATNELLYTLRNPRTSGAEDNFGTSVAIDNGNYIVGALDAFGTGAVYIFRS